ncbi:MAG TPA: SDR family oxidoreductase [Steroidobacteraceae bacterium]|nr:SDR family oxidoreductase [Steroidobacteraceae bacterium]
MSDATSPNVLIVGCGYTGARLARRLEPTHEVLGCVATPGSIDRLAAQGIQATVLDLDDAGVSPVDAEWLRGAIVCHLAPPPPAGTEDPRTRRLLELLPATPASLLYLSTTGVYGDCEGAVVTEATPIRPATDRARRRSDAEATVLRWCEAHDVRPIVLRVPGIYGPGRLPLERLRRGEPVIAAAEAGAGNRIHVDDLVTACELAIEQPAARGIYNVGDGNHASSSVYFATVARLAGLPAPREITMAEAREALPPAMLSFLLESRRVSTARIRDELGFVPRYAALEDGIRASLDPPVG